MDNYIYIYIMGFLNTKNNIVDGELLDFLALVGVGLSFNLIIRVLFILSNE